MKLFILLLIITFSAKGMDLINEKSIITYYSKNLKNPAVAIAQANHNLPLIKKLAIQMGVNISLSIAIAWTESNFNHQAISSAGAVGIMQIKPSTQKWMLKKYGTNNTNKIISNNLSEASVTTLLNMIASIAYLDYLLTKFDSIDKAIIAYNMGPRSTYKLIQKNYKLENHQYLKKVNRRLKLLASI